MGTSYPDLSIGSGNIADNKKLQELLNKNGYNVDVDGIFGQQTKNAVEAFQKAHNLLVDGIAGVKTFTALTGNGNKDEGKTKNSSYTYTPFEYDDYEESDAVNAAGVKKTEAEDAVANYGDFEWGDQGRYDTLIKEFENRPDFTYDFNADALYQQYKDKYIQQGKMAMADTIGQASAMTGGYGNSYAQTVGNQAYQASLQNLNDIIPELYQMAYDRYNQEGQDMLNMIGLLGNERDFAYGMWGDKYNQLVSDRDYYGSQYDSEWTRDYGQYEADRTLAHSEHTNAENSAYNTHRDTIEDEQWEKNYGLSERQLAMQEEAWELEQSAYGMTGGLSGDSSDSGGSDSGGGSYDNGTLSASQIKELQEALGVDADGYYGSDSKEAAGGLSAEEAYEKFVSNVPRKTFKDFDRGTLEKNQQDNGGSYYGKALEDIELMKSSGKSNAEIMAYLDELVGNSLISPSEMMTLTQKVRG